MSTAPAPTQVAPLKKELTPSPEQEAPSEKQMSTPTEATTKKMKLASYTRRFVAAFIDHFLIPRLLPFFIHKILCFISADFFQIGRANRLPNPWRRIVNSYALHKTIMQLIIAALNVSFKRGGLAHFLLGIKVVDANGEDMSLRMRALYELCVQMPFLLANIFTMILVTCTNIIELARSEYGDIIHPHYIGGRIISPYYEDSGLVERSVFDEHLEAFRAQLEFYRLQKRNLRFMVELIGYPSMLFYHIDLFIIPLVIGRPFFAYLLDIPPVKVVMN